MELKATIVQCLAEFTGTALLMLFGCFGCVTISSFHARDLFEIALIFGMAVTMAIHCFGVMSGCHINPSVSIASTILGLISWKLMLLYMLMQLLGSLTGFGILALIVNNEQLNDGNGLCTTIPHHSITAAQAIVIEFLITSGLILVCCAIWDPTCGGAHDSVSIKLGLLITGFASCMGNHTGGSMNFVRTLAPAVFAVDFVHIWKYFIAHGLAGVLAPLVWKYVIAPGGSDSRGVAFDDNA